MKICTIANCFKSVGLGLILSLSLGCANSDVSFDSNTNSKRFSNGDYLPPFDEGEDPPGSENPEDEDVVISDGGDEGGGSTSEEENTSEGDSTWPVFEFANIHSANQCLAWIGQVQEKSSALGTLDKVIQGLSGRLELGPVRDLTVNGISGQLDVESARDVSIRSVSGQVTVAQAQRALEAHGLSGSLFLRAVSVDTLSAFSGKVCVAAAHVGPVSATSGNITLVATSIESIHAVSGTIHVYAARIGRVNGVSGRVCLHAGAQVDSVGPSMSGRVGPCP